MARIQNRYHPVYLMRSFVLLAIAGWLLGLAAPAAAQVVSLYDVIYRPSGQQWLVVRDGSHRLIYPATRERQARETLDVLRRTKPGTNAFLGIERDFPLTAILTDQSDSGNGYVTPFPYKTEIEAVSLRGRELSRRHRSWVEVVTAHELVHAAQAEFQVRWSFTGVVGRFAPDFARALGLFQPSGFVEGLAVHRESRLSEDAGRLNHPFFLMQARAGMMDERWSLSQALEEPSFTRPFDRFYKGGALFAEFWMERYGQDALVASLTWQQHLPFSGFGSNLWLALDRSPSRVEQEFRTWFTAREDSLRRSIGTLSPFEVRASRKGQTHRRPYWLNQDEVLTYALGYDLPRGFQRVAPQGRLHRISTNEVSQDAAFHLTQDGTSILYSRLEEHPFSARIKVSRGYRLDLSTGKESLIHGSEHTVQPVALRDGRIAAIEMDGQYSRLVVLDGSGGRTAVLDRQSIDLVSLAPRPGSDSLAVVAKIGPHQAVFLVDTFADLWQFSPWIGFRNATVYDGAWSADGRFFSFTSDRTGILNVYVLDARDESIRQVTNALYGAMEGHVDPAGSRLIYVEYRGEQFDLVQRSLSDPGIPALNRDEANATWNTSWQTEQDAILDLAVRDSVFAAAKPYRSWLDLSPRMIYPTLYAQSSDGGAQDAHLGVGFGMAMQGTDPLQRNAWYGEGIIQRNRLWGEFGVQTGRWAVVPGARVARRPTLVDAVIRGQSGIRQVIRDRTSWSLTGTLPWTLEDNEYRSSVVTSVALSHRSERYLDDDLEVIQSRRSRMALAPSVYIGRRLLRNPRDLWPTSGQALSWFSDVELNRDVGEKRKGSVALLNVYLPWLRGSNTSLRWDIGHLYQNIPGVFGLRYIKPIGYEDAPVGDDSWLRTGLRIMQPVWFPDRGMLTVPFYLRAVYVRLGAETIADAREWANRYSTVSGGIGARIRLWHFFDVDLSWQAAYRIQSKDWDTVWTTLSEN
ncbi:MAG: hypothetical protein O3C45_03440 [Bacteroidetes bacterium]|nr:hypothetical protein [Bacteroidota bacterium]